ncbi:NAC domain-containing protein 83-like [Cucurbita pepo subsp. pepo]|uniref:NAC domain-containing protein 83-like n=1 Tax=Cucurbita pepo subsp. pepo TaxID=3664 RepID=UPI000C9D2C97|nr:NAC domain-containing protein 83-like [Cucurbita pepo subsp. pepo]
MEKLNFVKNGVLRLPPGFRFHPTDEELVLQYLNRKVLSCPLPASIIPDVDVCKADPWDLPGNMEQERYFFSTREAKYPHGNRSNRAAASGYWKATGIDKQILASKANQVVGLKKTLVFYRGKPPHGSRTDWIMHEYRLASPPMVCFNASQGKTTLQSCAAPMENWVLCRIFLKKRNGQQSEEEKDAISNRKSRRIGKPVFYEFMRKERGETDLNLAPSSSSSGSSGLTEISNNELDDHEESSSSCNTFPYFRRKS